MSKMKEGCRVIVSFSDSPRIEAIVKNIPQQTGEMWHFINVETQKEIWVSSCGGSLTSIEYISEL